MHSGAADTASAADPWARPRGARVSALRRPDTDDAGACGRKVVAPVAAHRTTRQAWSLTRRRESMPNFVDKSGTTLVDRARGHVTHEPRSIGARLLRGEASC